MWSLLVQTADTGTQVMINTWGWLISFVISVGGAAFVYYVKTSAQVAVSGAKTELNAALAGLKADVVVNAAVCDKAVGALRYECRDKYVETGTLTKEIHAMTEQLSSMNQKLEKQIDELQTVRRIVERRMGQAESAPSRRDDDRG